jgi:hypothetical protein
MSEWCTLLLGNVAPGQAARIVESGELVAVEAVAVAGEHVGDDGCKGDVSEDGGVARPEGMVLGGYVRQACDIGLGFVPHCGASNVTTG